MVRPVKSDAAIRPCSLSGSGTAATVPGATAIIPLQPIEHVAAGIPALPPPQLLHLPGESMSLDIMTAALPPKGEAKTRPAPGPTTKARISRKAAIRRTVPSIPHT